MKINFYATLRDIVGQKEVEFDFISGMTVREMIDLVIDKYPRLERELLDNDGNLYHHVHVFVNGRDAPYLEHAQSTRIQGSDKIDIFPAVGGGEVDRVSYIREMRGIPLWLLRKYLVDIGAEEKGENLVIGRGWQASLSQMEDFQVGSLVVGQVRLELQADPEIWKELEPVLEKKLLRAGG